MHGELIEFNERLYRSLMAKDHLIVQMRQELIDLRGPVSDEMPPSLKHSHVLELHHPTPDSCSVLFPTILVSKFQLYFRSQFDLHHHCPVFVAAKDICQ